MKLNILTILAIEKYNFLHISLLVFFIFAIIGSYLIFRKRSEKTKEIFLYILIGLAFFFAWSGYVVELITDLDDCRANFIVHMPLNLCSINALLYPLFFGFRKKFNSFFYSTLFSFMFFVGSIGAMLAMVVDAPKTVMGPNISLLSYVPFAYWIKHGLVLMIPILFVLLGFYKPKYLDIFKATIFFVIVLLIVHIMNIGFTKLNYLFGGTKVCNYFFTTHPDGMIGLSHMYNLIPIGYIYMLPFIFVAIPLFSLWYLPVGLVNLLKNKYEEKCQLNVDEINK